MPLKLLPIHRVSTAEQAGDNGEGLDRQREATRRLAESHGAVLLPPVEIDDVSGSDLDLTSEWRDRVLPVIAEPDVHVVADAIDRLLRVKKFNFRVFQDLVESKTLVYTPGKVYDLSDPEDSFMGGLFALIGGREASEIKRRSMAGREAARRRGEWPLKDEALPRGVTFNRETLKWGYTADADVIRFVFDQFVGERRSLRAIAREIGKPMQTVSVYLRNHIYRGILRYDEKRGAKYPSKSPKQKVARKKIKRAPNEIIEVRVFGDADKGQLPQLVDDATWFAAQQIMRANAQTSTRRREEGRPDVWASGFLVVDYEVPADGHQESGFRFLSLVEPVETEKHIVYANGGARSERRYTCRCTRRDAAGSMSRCWFRNPLANKVNATLDAYLKALTIEGWFLDSVRASLGNREDEAAKRRGLIEKRLRDLADREARLTRLYLAGRIGDEQHDNEQDVIRRDRDALTLDLAALTSDSALPTVADLDRLAAEWAWSPEWDHAKKRAWMERHVHEIKIDEAGIKGAVIRIPAGKGEQPVFGCGHAMPWVVPLFSRKPPVQKGTKVEVDDLLALAK